MVDNLISSYIPEFEDKFINNRELYILTLKELKEFKAEHPEKTNPNSYSFQRFSSKIEALMDLCLYDRFVLINRPGPHYMCHTDSVISCIEAKLERVEKFLDNERKPDNFLFWSATHQTEEWTKVTTGLSEHPGSKPAGPGYGF